MSQAKKDIDAIKSHFEEMMKNAFKNVPEELKPLIKETESVMRESIKTGNIEAVNAQINKIKDAQKSHSNR